MQAQLMQRIQPKIHMDGRGNFLETWRENEMKLHFVQANQSTSKPFVLRGLHFRAQAPQYKLMCCVYGVAIVVAVDVRRNSKSFGAWDMQRVTGLEGNAVLIPPYHAAGFLSMNEGAVMSYAMTAYHDPDDDCAVQALDPALGIGWPLRDYIRSIKDKDAPCLADLRGLPK